MKIILGTFKENADELAEFLGPRVGAEPDVGGGELNFDDEKVKKTIKSRHVKTYIKRFLNKKGERANYQIQVEGKQLRLIELEGSRGGGGREGRRRRRTQDRREGDGGEAGGTEGRRGVGPQDGRVTEEEGAKADEGRRDKKEGALDKPATKKQTKPKRKKAD